MHFVDKAVSEVGPIKGNLILTSTQADISAVFQHYSSMFPGSLEVLQSPIRIFYFLWLKYKAEGFVAMIYNKNWQLIRITLKILL